MFKRRCCGYAVDREGLGQKNIRFLGERIGGFTSLFIMKSEEMSGFDDVYGIYLREKDRQSRSVGLAEVSI